MLHGIAIKHDGSPRSFQVFPAEFPWKTFFIAVSLGRKHKNFMNSMEIGDSIAIAWNIMYGIPWSIKL